MKSQFQPWQFLVLILAGWINRRQQEAIDYLLTEPGNIAVGYSRFIVQP